MSLVVQAFVINASIYKMPSHPKKYMAFQRGLTWLTVLPQVWLKYQHSRGSCTLSRNGVRGPHAIGQLRFWRITLWVGPQGKNTFTALYKIESPKQKGGLYFWLGCWLRMSGFHYWMFKPRCLVFPFHWPRGQAGLCLALSHLPSRFPVKGGAVPSAAYLRNRCGISCPFYYDHAGIAMEMRAGAVTAHWQFVLRQLIPLDVYPQGIVENMASTRGDRRSSVHPFTCFVF